MAPLGVLSLAAVPVLAALAAVSASNGIAEAAVDTGSLKGRPGKCTNVEVQFRRPG